VQKNNAALLYVLYEIKCELCDIAHANQHKLPPCTTCDFAKLVVHYMKLAESEL